MAIILSGYSISVADRVLMSWALYKSCVYLCYRVFVIEPVKSHASFYIIQLIEFCFSFVGILKSVLASILRINFITNYRW